MKFDHGVALSLPPIGAIIAIREWREQRRSMKMPIKELVEAQVSEWHGVKPPTPTSHEAAQIMAGLIESFEKLRGELQFEDEPSSFEAVLLEIKEPAP
jgi:hypothetical protein